MKKRIIIFLVAFILFTATIIILAANYKWAVIMMDFYLNLFTMPFLLISGILAYIAVTMPKSRLKTGSLLGLSSIIAEYVIFLGVRFFVITGSYSLFFMTFSFGGCIVAMLLAAFLLIIHKRIKPSVIYS